MPVVTANGLRHHVVDEGRGPLVLLLHGFPETSHAWRHQVARARRGGLSRGRARRARLRRRPTLRPT